MSDKKQILAICGSASKNSSNLAILKYIKKHTQANVELTIFDTLSDLPHFQTELTNNNVPKKVVEFRAAISAADGIIICTPEYIFSIPSGLKNAIEWCVSTTVFSQKPIALITASAQGEKGHEELQLIVKTLQAEFTNETSLLIQGVKSKVDIEGKVTHDEIKNQLKTFLNSFYNLL